MLGISPGTPGDFLKGDSIRLKPCLFNLYVEHTMRNTELDELQAGIKIGGRNINNLRHVDDITLRAGSKEELKSLLMRVKAESERAGLKLNIMKKCMATHSSILAWRILQTEEPGKLQSMGSQRVRHD